MSQGRATQTAIFEGRIQRWPPDWGNELRGIVYGDFPDPQAQLDFPGLGITLEAGAVKESIVRSAMCVLKARVTVPERSMAGIADASARVNKFLGLVTAVGWGNGHCGWWSMVTHGGMAGMMQPVDHDVVNQAIHDLQGLDPVVGLKITSALYWIREPRQMMMEGYRVDVLRVYAGYWNAFECLVDAVCILYPHSKDSAEKKQQQLDKLLEDHGGKVNAATVQQMSRIVDPGFVAKASHALRICFPARADAYIHECFKVKPEADRLYDIRNAINHGDIDAANPEELIRVDDKHRRLWMIVFGMLGQFIPAVNRPKDES
jgi:hypothetical protein